MQGKPTKKQGFSVSSEPLKSLENKVKTLKKKEFFEKRQKKQGNPKKQGKEDQGKTGTRVQQTERQYQKTGTRVQKTERLYKNLERGYIHQNHPLQSRPFVSSRFSISMLQKDYVF